MAKDNTFAYINSIMEPNKPYMGDDTSEYTPFLTNRALSLHSDSIMYANELNRYPELPAKQQYDFYYHSIRKMRRKFAKWPKKPKDEVVQMLQERFEVNRRKAEQYALVLTEAQIEAIEAQMETGG